MNRGRIEIMASSDNTPMITLCCLLFKFFFFEREVDEITSDTRFFFLPGFEADRIAEEIP